MTNESKQFPQDAEFEAKMIARFNERVNEPSAVASQQAVASGKGSSEQFNESAENIKESGGPKGLEPTRYGDWEAKGRCHDF